MTTLHQYRWSGLNHCHRFIPLIDKQDKLIIYGEFSPQDQLNFIKQVTSLNGRCYWLSDALNSEPDIQNITHQQWLTLIAEHDKTYTWK